MKDDLRDRLLAMYSHRGDGRPTQYVNPDGREAAAVLAAKDAEIAFLKEIIFLHINPSEVRPEYYKKVHTILEELSQ